MIPKRLTEKFNLVVLHDPAIRETFSYDELAEYHMSGCDISKLDLKRCKDQPTIFTCEPLKTKYHYILDSIEGGLPTVDDNTWSLENKKKRPPISLNTAWQLFKNHVKEAKNYLDGKSPILTWDSKGVIEDECQENVDNDTLLYVACAILWKAGNIQAVFTVPGTLLGDILRSQFQLVSDASNEGENPAS